MGFPVATVCGKATKKGTPCQQYAEYHAWYRFGEYVFPCAAHRNEADRAVKDAYETGVRHGRVWGEDAVERESQMRDEIRRLKIELSRKASIPDVDDPKFRLRTERGSQIVKVTKGYTYAWCGDEPLQVGDVVQLPNSWLGIGTWEAEVLEIGSTYDGQLSNILRKVR